MTNTTALTQSFDDNWQPKYLYIIACCLLTALLTSNILAFKIVEVAGYKFGTAALLFPFSLVVGDIMTEVYGYKRSRQIIFINLIGFLFFSLMAQIAVALPHAEVWPHQQAYQTVFNAAPRILIAGCLSYVVSELINSFTMSRMKVKQKGRNFWLRALVAALFGELSHSIIFVPIVFWTFGWKVILAIMVNATIVKLVVQSLMIPLTQVLKNKMIALEQVDHFDGKI